MNIINWLNEPMNIFVNNLLLFFIVLFVVYIISLIYNIIIIKKEKSFNKVYPTNTTYIEKTKVYKYTWKYTYKILLFGFQSILTSSILLHKYSI